ncbi:MAG: hypothetical protein ASARMPRED_009249 [Alectoria sarmentosa]|nr:MAG: hypothetical protein ASARMPRED_009249 [Alectoria sarmentosa]
MSGKDSAALKILIASAAGILWVTQGYGERAQRPELGLVTGFGRNVGSETWGNRFVELAVYHEGLLLDWPESEYREKDGRLCISRVVEAQDVNVRFGAKAPEQTPKQREYGLLPNQALELNIGSPGLLGSFHLKDNGRFDMRLGADEVEVKVQVTGINFKDALIALGQLPGKSLGYECAGFVNRVGKDATFSPGDRVLCRTTTEASKTYARAHTTSVARVPHDVPFPTAAALATVFCTAYHFLFNAALVAWRPAHGAPFAQNATFASVDLGILMDQAKPTMAVVQLYLAAKITVPQPLHVFSVSELEKAFRFMQSGKNMGKIVVEIQADAIVPVVPSPKSTYSFDANATYDIAGGLGGPGRSITRWMVDWNYFILLSRSGAESKDATGLVSDMSQRSVWIAAPSCDISTEGAMLNVLRDQEHQMPPVKGCIQASMALKDGLEQRELRRHHQAQGTRLMISALASSPASGIFRPALFSGRGIESLKADKLEKYYWAKKPLFSILKQKRDVDTSTSGNAGGTVDYAHLLTSAESQAVAVGE